MWRLVEGRVRPASVWQVSTRPSKFSKIFWLSQTYIAPPSLERSEKYLQSALKGISGGVFAFLCFLIFAFWNSLCFFLSFWLCLAFGPFKVFGFHPIPRTYPGGSITAQPQRFTDSKHLREHPEFQIFLLFIPSFCSFFFTLCGCILMGFGGVFFLGKCLLEHSGDLSAKAWGCYIGLWEPESLPYFLGRVDTCQTLAGLTQPSINLHFSVHIGGGIYIYIMC